jgi:hypothetical protein
VSSNALISRANSVGLTLPLAVLRPCTSSPMRL